MKILIVGAASPLLGGIGTREGQSGDYGCMFFRH